MARHCFPLQVRPEMSDEDRERHHAARDPMAASAASGYPQRVAAERDVLKVKDDEYVSPTNARDLAEGISLLLDAGNYGLYHLTNAGSCSWYEFTREIFRLSGVETELVPIPSSEYPLPAARPANGVLSTVGSPKLRTWQEALADFLERETADGSPGRTRG